jgi:hypothetical protein
LELLSENVRSNAPGARVCRLVWGSDDPLKQLGLVRKPDVVLASDVVYGNDPTKWNSLVKTMRDLCGRHTLVIVGNVQRYPVHHPMAESRFFHESTAVGFYTERDPDEQSAPRLPPDRRGELRRARLPKKRGDETFAKRKKRAARKNAKGTAAIWTGNDL